MDLTYTYYDVNGVNLHVGHAGKQHRKILLFLHGFPEYSYGWKNQIPFFVEKGYHVVVPDQRGYNLSSKPQGIAAYKLEILMRDIVELIKSITSEKIIIIGHDWGGAVSWALALHHPELIAQLIILNMPHPQVMRETLKTNPKQMLKSWYAGFFQVPRLPEFLISRFDYKILASGIRKNANNGAISLVDIEQYKKAWRQRDALKSMINWYRAFRESNLHLDLEVSVPTLILWGIKDQFLIKEMAGKSLKRCLYGQLIFFQDLTHWLHHEDPERINNMILEFISKANKVR
jgi:epoxide hydrolase 4